MIPHKLELKNFLSYGEELQSIDFKGHGLICLSGKNGNGKSALLDALTWALWGHARKISGSAKADEGLLRLGCSRMMVSLEFEVNQVTYRVRREFAKTYGRPYSALDCEVYDPFTSKFSSLTDKTVRATQEKIDAIIGIDFETFINSAFLRQGQANEFSKKTAKDRKQILATILGLSHYDHLAQMAQEQIKLFSDEKKLIIHQQTAWMNECEQEPQIQAIINDEKQALLDLNTKLVAHTQKLKELDTLLLTTSQQLKRKEELLIERKSLLQQEQEKLSSLKILVTEWKKVHKALLNQLSLPNLEHERQHLDEQLQELLKKKQAMLSLKEQLLNLKEQQTLQHGALKQQYEALAVAQQLTIQKKEFTLKQVQEKIVEKENILATLEKKQENFTLSQKDLQKDISKSTDLEREINVCKAQFDKRKAFYQTLIQKGNWFKNSLSDIDQRKQIICETTNPSCPLCEQVLTVKRKQFLQGQMSEQEIIVQRKITRISGILKKLKDLLYTQHQELERYSLEIQRFKEQKTLFDNNEKQQDILAEEIAHIEQEVVGLHEQAIISSKELAEATTELGRLSQEASNIIATDKKLLMLQENIAALEQQKTIINFDQQYFDSLTQVHASIQQQIIIASRATEQRDFHKKLRTSISNSCQELKLLKQIINKSIIEAAAYQEADITHKTTEQSIIMTQAALHEVTLTKDQLLQNLGKHEHTLARIQSLKNSMLVMTEKASFLDSHIDDYQMLAQTFSKNGIQALLIEQAIPEIEAEANTLLAKLSNNQSHIFIESLKDLKSGGVKETLDIHISDAAGIRPYEMFSGGEAFRVDFALRIAISKLLARRAGTSLQTLIIDEGFGSQDEEGLGLIMDALYAIQKDFAKIIVVSHLPDFKENFPVHFIIEKNALGSIVNVFERG